MSLAELMEQRQALERQIQTARAAGRAEALAEIRRLMAEHGLMSSDVASAPGTHKAGPRPGKKVAPKYRDPESGATWTGRGLKPRWLTAALESGRSLSDYAV